MIISKPIKSKDKMCEDCFDKEYYGFPSQVEFEKFEEVLDFKCSSEKVQTLKSKNKEEIRLIGTVMNYECNTCSEIFALSIPENAWRGYFLKKQNAAEHDIKLKTLDKKKKYGCLIILVLIIIGIYYIVK